jgi:hypothetical protein
VKIRAQRIPRPADIKSIARGAQLSPRSCSGILQSVQADVAVTARTGAVSAYRTNPTDRLIAGSRASRLSRPARDVCKPMGRALGGGGGVKPPSSCSAHPGLTQVLIRFGCRTLFSPTPLRMIQQ